MIVTARDTDRTWGRREAPAIAHATHEKLTAIGHQQGQVALALEVALRRRRIRHRRRTSKTRLNLKASPLN
jgi:hypothetical protein